MLYRIKGNLYKLEGLEGYTKEEKEKIKNILIDVQLLIRGINIDLDIGQILQAYKYVLWKRNYKDLKFIDISDEDTIIFNLS